MAQYDFTIRAKDETGAFADRTFNIEVQNNLVDQFAYCDDIDIYTSIDGKNWSKRGGQGVANGVVYYVNGWWVLFDGTYIVKRSKDAITWESMVARTPNINGLDASFDDVLSNMYFGIPEDNLAYPTIINGWTYINPSFMYGYGNNVQGEHGLMLRTQDFIEYEVVNYNGITKADAVADYYANWSNGDWSEPAHRSNIIQMDGYYWFACNSSGMFRSLDLTSWEKYSTLPNHYYYSRLYNVNGVVVKFASTQRFSYMAGNNTVDIQHTTNMASWTKSISNAAGYGNNVASQRGCNVSHFYVNGHFMMITGNYAQLTYNVCSDLQNWQTVDVGALFANVEFTDGSLLYGPGAFVYDGEIYFYDAHKNNYTGARRLHKYDISTNTLVQIPEMLPSLPRYNIGVIR